MKDGNPIRFITVVLLIGLVTLFAYRGILFAPAGEPAYRMLIFWFRFSGFLHAVAEPGTWRVADPVSQAREGVRDLGRRAGEIRQALRVLCRRGVEFCHDLLTLWF